MHPLEHIKSFAKMTPEIEATLSNLMIERTFKKGEIIRGAVNLANCSYYIKQGAARLFITTNGKEHTLSFSFDNEFIVAPLHTIKEHPDTITIQFIETTEVIYLPITRIKNILNDSSGTNTTHPQGEHAPQIPETTIETISALLFLNTALSRYTSFLEERIYIMQTLNAPQRYQWLINRYPRISKSATTTQIASYLGLTKETLYRIRNNKY